MAEIAVSFLLNQLANLIQEKRPILEGVQKRVLEIKGNLDVMRAFLRVADAKEDRDLELQAWVKQVREVAYDAEDVLEAFLLRFSHLRASGGFCGCVQKMYISLMNLGACRHIVSDLHNIEARVQKISEGHQRYQGKYGAVQQQGSGSTSTWLDRRGDALLVEEAKLVGIEGPKEVLIKELLDGGNSNSVHLKAVSVVGMGGSGKSTLVKRIYEDEQVKANFHCHAWLTVSQSFDIKELLKDLIRQLHDEIKEPVDQQVEFRNADNLKVFVQNFLRQRKYIIVFDDIWNVDSWEVLKHSLPDSNTSSRVLLTTRILDVASATRPEYFGYVYKMKALSHEESWTLFCNKTFVSKICPPHLNDVAQGILAKCEGLPLAIVAVGGLLSLKDVNRIEEWEMVHSNLNTELDGDGKLEMVKEVLFLSYYDLPYFLKTCLLYLSIFPEDYKIDCVRLIRLWAAEGLLQGREGMTKEDVALGYLHELINRSLIQVADTTGDGRVKLCRIHDIVREIIVSKSREQNIVSMVRGRDSTLPDKVRRFAIHSPINSPMEMHRLKHLRSLILSSASCVEFVSEPFLHKLLARGRKLLKVLDLQGAPLENIPNVVFKLYHLTYLSLRSTRVKVIPESIGQLLCLETLDLKDTEVVKLPIQILRLQRLRHILVYKYRPMERYKLPFDYIQTFKAPYRIGCLSSLQKLYCIEADHMGDTTIVREIGKLTELRRLGIRKLRREDGKDLCASLEKLTQLRSLNVASIGKDEIIDLQYSLSSPLPFLRSLCLVGKLEKMPEWIPSLRGLTQVTLRRNKLRDHPLESLQDLPSLTSLMLDCTFEGDELVFKAGKFQCLKNLWIWRLKGLKHVVVENDSMPNLDELYLGLCNLMEELPIGFEYLTKLQYFQINDMTNNFVTALENQKTTEGDNWMLAHVPKIVVAMDSAAQRWRCL